MILTEKLEKIKTKCREVADSIEAMPKQEFVSDSHIFMRSAARALLDDITAFELLRDLNCTDEVLNPSVTMMGSFDIASKRLQSIADSFPEEML